jgi:enhancer of mRNA-decapping protein 4
MEVDCEPKLLHAFSAHDGRPLSCLYFLDNLRVITEDMKFWKYAITGADYNREIKLWCCSTFTCLQTINFRPPPSLDSWFKVEVDASGKYIMLSDIHRRMLYVLYFHESETPSCSHIASISEFPLALPFLCFKIKEAGRRKLKQKIGEEEVNGDDSADRKKVFVEMFAVQPMGIQKCTMFFDPHSSVPDGGSSSSSYPTFSLDESVVQDNLAELSASCLGMDQLEPIEPPAPVPTNGIGLQNDVELVPVSSGQETGELVSLASDVPTGN